MIKAALDAIDLEFDPDDEDMLVTPPDVVDELGFDPLEFEEPFSLSGTSDGAEKGKSPPPNPDPPPRR